MKTYATPFKLACAITGLALAPAFSAEPKPASSPGAAPPATASAAPGGKSAQTSTEKESPATAAAPKSPAPAAANASTDKGIKEILTPKVFTENRSERTLIDRKVRGRDGAKLGEVEDLLVDPLNGEIGYAVIESGWRDKLRLVPFAALQRTREKEGDLFVALDQNAWDQVAPIAKETLQADRVAVPDAQRRQLAQRFALTKPNDPANAAALYTAGDTQHLLRASRIRGQEVRSGGELLGKIDDLVIDDDAGKVSAVLHAQARSMNSEKRFDVPLRLFAFGSNEREQVTTILTRDDLEPPKASSEVPVAKAANSAQPGNTAAAATPPAASNGQQPAVAQAAPSASPQNATAKSATAKPAATPLSAAPATGAAPSPDATAAATTPASGSKAQASGATPSAPAASAKPEQNVAANSASSAQPNTAGQKENSPAKTNVAAAQPPAKATAEAQGSPSPTGKTSAEQMPAGADGALMQAARSIRTALDEDAAALARVEVQVSPENGHLVLRGSVADENLKKSVEATAAAAAKGAKLDSQITVQGK